MLSKCESKKEVDLITNAGKRKPLQAVLGLRRSRLTLFRGYERTPKKYKR